MSHFGEEVDRLKRNSDRFFSLDNPSVPFGVKNFKIPFFGQ